MSDELKLPELLPCPFCGAEAQIKGRKTVMVNCSKCSAATFQRLEDKQSAIRNWNTRAAIEQSRSVAPPALYQHDDGRYALAMSDVARHRLTDGDPAWHRVPLDVVVAALEPQGDAPNG